MTIRYVLLGGVDFLIIIRIVDLFILIFIILFNRRFIIRRKRGTTTYLLDINIKIGNINFTVTNIIKFS